MKTIPKFAVLFSFVAALLMQTIVNQKVYAQTIDLQKDFFSSEIKSGDIDPKTLRKLTFDQNAQPINAQKEVRIIYLVPSDKTVRNDYRAALADAAIQIQDFYRRELGNGNTFSLHSPVVEVYQTPNPSSWYATNSVPNNDRYLWFYLNLIKDGFPLSGGSFYDPNNRWIYFIDADSACDQISVGGAGNIAIHGASIFRGLTRQAGLDPCPDGQPEAGRYNRTIGGIAHEMGHAFDLPHPPGCGESGPNHGCTGGSLAQNSLMWTGYFNYPNTYFLPEHKQVLLNSGFFSNLACPTPSAVNPGQTINGILQSGDCQYTDGSFYDAYTFSGTAGQQIYTTLNSTQFDAYLILVQGNYPGGNILAQDNGGGGGTNARIPAVSGFFTLPATGTYTILANSVLANETGSYSLFLGTNCNYTVTQSGVSVPEISASGGTRSYNVTAAGGCSWSATSSVVWITVASGSSGSGNGTVTVNIAANTGVARNGSVTIAGQIFNLFQQGVPSCSYSVSQPPGVPEISASGGVSSFNITAPSGCFWSATSNVSWITLATSNSGSGSGTVSFNIAPNTGGARSGTVTIAGQTFSIFQQGVTPCSYSVSQIGIGVPEISANGGNVGFSVNTQSGCSWFAQSNVSWINITSANSGNGSGSVNFSIAANTGTSRSGSVTIASQSFSLFQQSGPPNNTVKKIFDFDGDGKTDIAIFRPANGQWWINRSSNGQTFAAQFGQSTDRITSADFTGDSKTDIAFFRPSSGEWFVLRSEDNSFFSFPFGTNGDVPAPADYDGDGKADPAVFRPSTQTWFILRSMGGVTIQQFGAAGDVPAVADYDGDNKADIAIYRPSLGQWWLNRSSAGAIAFQFGNSADKPVQGDYTGDGKADVAFFRPSTNEWFVLRSENASFYSFPFGASGDVPTPGDYDGDGKADAAVFRPSTNTWFAQRATAGTLIQTFGQSGDKPVPNAFVP